MTFLENGRLPDFIDAGSAGGPAFLTTKRVYFDGSEKRIVNWSEPRQKYNIRFSYNDLEALQAVVDQFYAAQGTLNGFRKKDRLDHSIPWDISGDNRQQIAVGDGSATTFQIIKSYVTNSGQYDRTIEKIVSGTDRVWIDTTELTRVPSSPGAGEYSIDITTGQITTGDTPAGGQVISVQCQFDVPVRFEEDEIDLSLESAQTGAETGAISRVPLISLKPRVWPASTLATAFLEDDRLPQYVGEISGGPKFKTNIRILKSGYEQRASEWLDVRGEWTLSFGLHEIDLPGNPIRDLIDLFYVAMGCGLGFRFEDPLDHDLTAEQIGTGDGTTTIFQATKTYQTLSGAYTKTITKPQGQLQALVDDAPVSSTTDTATGLVTLAAPAGNGLSVKVTGPFDLPVRFDSDEIEFPLARADDSEINDDIAASSGRLRLVELKP